jgi:hypothetical protein
MFEVYSRSSKKHVSIDESGIQLVEIKKEMIPRYTVIVTKDNVQYEKRLTQKAFDVDKDTLTKLFHNLNIKEVQDK